MCAIRAHILASIKKHTHKCTHHGKPILDSQDQPSLRFGDGVLQPLMGCLDPLTGCEQVIYLQGTHDLGLFCNS